MRSLEHQLNFPWKRNRRFPISAQLGRSVAQSLTKGDLKPWRYFLENEQNFRGTDLPDFSIDEVLFGMHLADRVAFAGIGDRQTFLNAMMEYVAAEFTEAGYFEGVDEALDYLVRRANEKQKLWGAYELLQEKGAPLKGWLFWEASHDLTGSKNVVFVALYAERLVDIFTAVSDLVQGK